MPKKENNPKKSNEEIKFEHELNKLRLSAEHGLPFLDEKKEEIQSETEEEFLERMREFEDAMENPDEKKIAELLGYPNFPKADALSDAEISAALELAINALANKSIVLDVIYPTPDREIYRFITEELLKKESGMAGAGGMTTHFIYEEFYPNHTEDINEVVTQILHFICNGYKGSLPWRIDNKVLLYGEIVPQEEFEGVLDNHRHIFKGMNFIKVDSIKINFKKSKAHAKAKFRFYLDKTSGQPGEISATAEFYFALEEDTFWLNRLVIDHFGIE